MGRWVDTLAGISSLRRSSIPNHFLLVIVFLLFWSFVLCVLFLCALSRRSGPGRNLYTSSFLLHGRLAPRDHICSQNDLAWVWIFPICDLKVLTTFIPVRDSHKFAEDSSHPGGAYLRLHWVSPQKPREPYWNDGYPVILTAQILGDQVNMIADAIGCHAAVYMWCIFIGADPDSKATTAISSLRLRQNCLCSKLFDGSATKRLFNRPTDQHCRYDILTPRMSCSS